MKLYIVKWNSKFWNSELTKEFETRKDAEAFKQNLWLTEGTKSKIEVIIL